MERVAAIEMTNGNASGLARKGNFLYMVMNESVTPLLVFDISEPSRPRLLKRLRAPGWPMRCRVIADRWLWTVHRNGEAFFDISVPGDPKLLTAKTGGPTLRWIDRRRFSRRFLTYISCCKNDVLYFGSHGEDPGKKASTPARSMINDQRKSLSQDDGPGISNSPAKKLADNPQSPTTKLRNGREGTGPWRKTRIFDIKDPQHPRLIATIKGVIPRTLQGNILFTTGKDIRVYDIASPQKPALLCSLRDRPGWKDFKLRGSECYAYSNGRLYLGIVRDCPDFFGYGPITNAQAGVAVVDARNWNELKLLGHGFSTDKVASMGVLVLYKGHVFTNDPGLGLRVFDVRDPQHIVEVARYRVGGELSAALLIPNRKLLAIGQNINGNVFLVDVSDPMRPELLGTFHHGLRVWGKMACYKGEYLYFQADKSRPWGASILFTLDIRDPRKPEMTCAIPRVARSYSMFVVDNYLYSCSGEIYRLDDPARPEIQGQRLPASGYEINYRKPFLFVINPYGEKHGALSVIDVRSHSRPALVSTTPLPGQGHRVTTSAILGRYLIVSWGRVVYAVDIADARRPQVIRRWHITKDLGLPTHYSHVWTDGETLFVGSYTRQLGAYDVGVMPRKPGRLGLLTWAPSAWLMAGQKGFIYRVCLNRLQVIRYSRQD